MQLPLIIPLSSGGWCLNLLQVGIYHRVLSLFKWKPQVLQGTGKFSSVTTNPTAKLCGGKKGGSSINENYWISGTDFPPNEPLNTLHPNWKHRKYFMSGIILTSIYMPAAQMLISGLVTGNSFKVSAKKLSLAWHDSSDLFQAVIWDVFPLRREARNVTALSDEYSDTKFSNAALSYCKKKKKRNL